MIKATYSDRDLERFYVCRVRFEGGREVGKLVDVVIFHFYDSFALAVSQVGQSICLF